MKIKADTGRLKCSVKTQDKDAPILCKHCFQYSGSVVGERRGAGALVPRYVVCPVATRTPPPVVQYILGVSVHVLRQHGPHSQPDVLNAADREVR